MKIVQILFICLLCAVVSYGQTPDTFTVYEVAEVEVAPAFPGGDQALIVYLGKNMTLAVLEEGDPFPGTMVVSFIVNETGKITDAKIVKGGEYGKELLRVIHSMPDWTPGYFHRKPVKVRYTLPVRFRLD